MPRPKGSYATPKYRLHKATGRAVVTIAGKDHYLQGGMFGTRKTSPATWDHYDRVIAQWRLSGGVTAQQTPASDITFDELIAAYWAYISRTFPVSRWHNLRSRLRVCRRLYGPTKVADFGPMKMAALQDEMINTKVERHPDRTWSRKQVNCAMAMVRLMLKWGTKNELVAPGIYTGACSIEPLASGKTRARETEDVQEVPIEHVEPVLKHVSPIVATMIKLQLRTGMRSGEVCSMRTCDIEMQERVWIYRPQHHKTERRGKSRNVYIGREAQDVLRPYLRTDLHAYLFDPRESARWHIERRRANARRPKGKYYTPVDLSQSRKHFNARFDPSNYHQAVTNAIKQADREAHKHHPEIPAGQPIIPHWHPHQLRHAFAMNIADQKGDEAARILLGHTQMRTTWIYAKREKREAAHAMQAIAEVG